MTRRSVGDHQEIYRVVVRSKKKIDNPDFGEVTGARRWLLSDEEYDTSYGPYTKIGSARGVETIEAYVGRYVDGRYDPHAERRFGVVDSWIEKVSRIEWERI